MNDFPTYSCFACSGDIPPGEPVFVNDKDGGAPPIPAGYPFHAECVEYEFTNTSNSYFMGNDVLVTRTFDGRSIRINGKDGMCAVEVKDHDGSWLGALPDDVRKLAEDLNRANAHRLTQWADDDWTTDLYRTAAEGWWESATEGAKGFGFDGVYSAGRSGGWCCIDGTNAEDAQRIFHPQDEDDRDFRGRFLGLAFELVSTIASEREWWQEQIIEDHADLEDEREECLIRGTE